MSEEERKIIDRDGETWYVRERPTTEDELALGYAKGLDGAKKIFVMKGVNQDHRNTHFYIIGASGTGKTKFLEYLIAQDLSWFFGVGVIDPTGDLVQEVKSMLVLHTSQDLASRVVLIDPTDRERCVSFNPLELTGNTSAATLAGQLIKVFKKIWGEDSVRARTEDVLRNTLCALIENGQTLAEVQPLLTDAAVRERFVRNVKNEECQRFFAKFETWTKHEQTEYTGATTNKVSGFLADDQVRQILISPKSSFNLRDVMDDGKVLLVNLDKGHLGESGELLGSLLLSRIQTAALTRSDTKKEERKPFYLYIDEFQNYAADDFTEIINESRKYKLILTLAHQDLAQLTTQLRASVRNCGLQAYFRLNRLDAEQLAKEAFAGIYDVPIDWESHIELLQSLDEAMYVFKSKKVGGAAVIEVPRFVDSAREKFEASGGDEFTTSRFASIGEDYLRKREDIEREYRIRRDALGASNEPEGFREGKRG